MSDFALIVTALLMFGLGVIASGCETAFFAADRIRLRHLATTGSKRARRALDMTHDPERVLATLLAVYNVAEVGCSAVCTVLATRWFGESAITVVTVGLVPVWLVFNQIIPKALFLSYATSATVMFSDSIRVSSMILMPLVRRFGVVTYSCTERIPTTLSRVPWYTG